MSVSYVPNVTMFPYWTGHGGLVKQVNELSKENRVLEGTMKRYSEANMELKQEKEDIHKQYRKKIDTLVEQKQELEAKVDEAQVAFEENKMYKKEIDTLRESVENECEASGIMEIMNMRIEDADNKAREQEVLKVIAEKELEKEVREKKELHKEINELGDALENAEIYKCEQCSEYFPIAGIECCFIENNNYGNICLECRDEHYTQCDECMDYHHNTNITNIEDRDVCTYCNSIP